MLAVSIISNKPVHPIKRTRFIFKLLTQIKHSSPVRKFINCVIVKSSHYNDVAVRV